MGWVATGVRTKDVVVLEGADDLEDGVAAADVGQELVAQALRVWYSSASLPRRSSGTGTIPVFGSMVANG